MDIKIIKNQISLKDIKQAAEATFGDMVKAVVDVEKEILALGGDLHADAEKKLLDQGSNQANLWGINIYPEKIPGEYIEFTSLINIRPAIGNRSLEIKDETIKNKIKRILEAKIIL